MSFSSGTFTLVAGNPVVTGTTISSTTHNNTMTDIATGLSTAVLKDGTQVCTAAIPFVTGVTTTSTTFAVFNTVATTINAFGAATTTNIGNASGTTNILGTANLTQITGDAVATQAQQETATATTLFVCPGRQHFHPSAAKVWCQAGVAGNIASSYNMTSVTDVGTGQIAFIIGTDFSSSNWCSIVQGLIGAGGAAATTYVTHSSSQAAGQILGQVVNLGDYQVSDPTNWMFVGYGDQA